jgi:hypothetical protein
MVVVLHAPPTGGAGARDDGSDDYTKTFEDEKARLVDMLTRGVIPTPRRDYPDGHTCDTRVPDGKAKTSSPEAHTKEGGSEEGKEEDNNGGGGIRVTSIYFQEYEGLSLPTPDHPVQVSYSHSSFMN